MQFSTTIRNARADVVESTIGASAILRIFTGEAPAATSDADSGTEIVEMSLPSDWMAAASGGTKALAGSWTGTAGAAADLTSSPGHFRIYASDGTTVGAQGSCGGVGQELVLNNPDVEVGQTVTVTAFTLTEGNA